MYIFIFSICHFLIFLSSYLCKSCQKFVTNHTATQVLCCLAYSEGNRKCFYKQ